MTVVDSPTFRNVNGAILAKRWFQNHTNLFEESIQVLTSTSQSIVSLTVSVV